MVTQIPSTHIANQADIEKKITAMAQVIFQTFTSTPLVLIGIRKGGDVLAARLASQLQQLGANIQNVATLDITLYRDDFGHHQHWPELKASEINCSLEKANIVLVDDVLFTGRTVRAALEALLDYGRPARVLLAVLVDRGHRQLPIAADVIGFKIELARDILCEVQFCEQGFMQDAITLLR